MPASLAAPTAMVEDWVTRLVTCPLWPSKMRPIITNAFYRSYPLLYPGYMFAASLPTLFSLYLRRAMLLAPR